MIRKKEMRYILSGSLLGVDLNDLQSAPAGYYAIHKAIILCDSNVWQNEKRIYLPIYMIMFLQQKEMENQVVTIDLKGLVSQ